MRAAEISAPAVLLISGKPGIPNCTFIPITAEDSDALIIQNAWAAFPSKSLADYSFSAADTGLTIEHPYVVWLNEGKANVQLCVFGAREGVYRGVVLSRASRSAAGVGTWVVVNLSGRSIEKQVDTSSKFFSEETTAGAEAVVDRKSVV